MAGKIAAEKNVNQALNRADETGRIHEFDQVILGDGFDCMFSTDCGETGLNNNVLVVGANRIIGLSQMTFRKQRVQTT